MLLDLKKIPFGQHLSRHLLFREDDPLGVGREQGLYLGLANESSSMFAGFAARSAGFILLKPTVEGREADYSLQADPASALVDCGKGGGIRFAIDGCALLLQSDGPGLELTVRLGFGETVSRTERGYELNLGATKYVIATRKGKAELEVMWDLTALKSTDPVITLTPEDGVLDVVIWDTTGAYKLPEIAPDVDAAAKKAQAAFRAFCAKLPAGASELLAYNLWMGFQGFRGDAMVCSNKINDNRFQALHQAVSALAFREAEDVIDLLGALLKQATPGGLVPCQVKESGIVPEAAPPLYGLALSMAANLDKVPKEKLEAFYALYAPSVAWWLSNRCLPDGACYYAYPHECGWEGAAILRTGEPAVSPDLAVWMYLSLKVLSDMAVLLGRQEEALAYAQGARKQWAVLLRLWQGGGFVCRSALTDEVQPCRTALGLVPLLLGGALPAEMRTALEARALKIHGGDSLLSGIVALGAPALAARLLAQGGEKQAAPAAAAYDPARCALLLALKERS